jgi:peptidoglycan hydrolase-like protein with peptidoglycan-binding domain
LQLQIDGLLTNVRSLQSQLQAKQQGSPAQASAFGQQVRAIATSMTKGSRGNDVSTLQQFLISQNKGPATQALSEAGATAYFGVLTRAALAEFQATVGISPALGNFGPITRAYLMANY